jgi:hypothetical protein
VGRYSSLIKFYFENSDGSTFTEDTSFRKRFQRTFNSPNIPTGSPLVAGGIAYVVHDQEGMFAQIQEITGLGRPRRLRIVLSLLDARDEAGATTNTHQHWLGTFSCIVR